MLDNAYDYMFNTFTLGLLQVWLWAAKNLLSNSFEKVMGTFEKVMGRDARISLLQ
jgi:hypothetical protein